MDNMTNKLRCPKCGTSFPVELHKMRVNVTNLCPSCGCQCGISENQAISAHRLLERMEYQKRTVSLQFGATRSA
jgi:hypothetical protein